MKRWLAAILIALLIPLPSHAAEKSSITLRQYSTYSTSLNLAFDFTGSAESLRITVDPQAVGIRSALDDKSEASGPRYTFAITKSDSVEISLVTPVLKVQGAHRATAELISQSKVVAKTSFFVSQLGGNGVKRTPVVWIWPITERPHRGLDNVFIDDQLATDISENGRLTQLIRAGAGTSVVWALDPELLASVEQMSLGYQVRRGKELVAGSGVEAAKAWLASLIAATNGREVIALPYADPDLSSISAAQLAALRTQAERTVSRILGRDVVTTNIGWTADRGLSAAAGELAAVIMPSPAMDVSATPTSVGPLVGNVRALVADSALTKALARNDVMGANRALAELATITAERPSDPRPQLLLPPRNWNPSLEAVTTLIAATRGDTRSLSYLLTRPAGQYSLSERSVNPLPRQYLDALKSMGTKVAQTQTVLGDEYEPTSDRYARTFTAVNANFRQSKSTLVAALDKSATSYVNTLRILPGRYVLTGREQSIPLTIVNGFDKPVRLSVDLVPHARRVIIRNAGSIDIPANGRTQLQVPVESVATGRVAADAYLVASNGERYGDGVILNLDVRNIGPVGDWILYGPAALLALALLLRLTRRIRSSRRG